MHRTCCDQEPGFVVGAKRATARRCLVTLIAHPERPEQAPPQPEKRFPAPGCARRRTTVPSWNRHVHRRRHVREPGAATTDPNQRTSTRTSPSRPLAFPTPEASTTAADSSTVTPASGHAQARTMEP